MSEKRNFNPLGSYLIGMWSERSMSFMFLSYCKRFIYRIVSKEPLNLHQYYLVWKVSLGDELQHVKLHVWLDQICSKYLQYMWSGRSSFCIDWYWPWISTWIFMGVGFIKITLSCDRIFSIGSNDPQISFSLYWKLMTGWWIWDCISDIWNCKIFIIH